MSKFVLQCAKKRHKDIYLPNLVPVYIGRSPLTQIKDPRLSRKHVKLIANEASKLVNCSILGSNNVRILSKLGSTILKTNESINLQAGDKLELLEGKYEHVLVLKTDESGEDKMPTASNVRSNHWSQALYASMQDKNLLVFEDERIVIIKDKYPKAKHHFLVLPRDKMATLEDLHDIDLLQHMINQAQKHLLANFKATFKLGFHAIPSMAQVHMHVISQDFDSPCLKNKKHWNSFNTKYFVESEKVLQMLRDYGEVRTAEWSNKELLKEDLKCNQCSLKPKNIPELKQHLKSHVTDL